MSTGRRITFWAIALALPLIAGLIGIYIVSYLTVRPLPIDFEGDSIIAYDPEIGYVPRPNSRTKATQGASPDMPAFSYNLYTDDRGARITIPGQKSPARIDIAMIGDSFTWGHGFENQATFTSQVAQRLGMTTSNFSTGGFGTVQALQMLRHNRDLLPKLVVYGFIQLHLGRNVRPCAPSYYPFCLDVARVTWDANDRPQITPPRSDGVRRAQLQVRARDHMLDPITWITHGIDVAFNRLTLRMGNFLTPDDARQEAAFAFLLDEMAHTADAMGAKLLVVYIPIFYAPPSAALLRTVAKLNVPFLDMTDAFRSNQESSGSPSAYIPGDGHPSVTGHALIAEEIIRTIQRDRLLDRPPARPQTPAQ